MGKEMKMNDVHKSRKIDELLGQYVKITFFDDFILDGWLMKYEDGKYFVRGNNQGWSFRKSHIKSIKKK